MFVQPDGMYQAMTNGQHLLLTWVAKVLLAINLKKPDLSIGMNLISRITLGELTQVVLQLFRVATEATLVHTAPLESTPTGGVLPSSQQQVAGTGTCTTIPAL